MENEKPLFYSVWMITDQKWNTALLVGVSFLVGVIVWLNGSSPLLHFMALLLFAGTMEYVFVPIRIELHSGGIVYRPFLAFRRKRLISWDDIRSYQVHRNGILLLHCTDRFFLEAFRGFFLPVPSSLMPEVLYRLRIFVDKIPD
jgi:hypothetical protein